VVLDKQCAVEAGKVFPNLVVGEERKRNVLRRCLNSVSDGADVMCGGRLFQKLAPKTGKARLPTVERLNAITASWLKEADRSLCRNGNIILQCFWH